MSESEAVAVATPSKLPRSRWLMAIIAGVVVSVAASVAWAVVVPRSGNAGIGLGLVVGTLVTGVSVGAHTVRGWVNAALGTFVGQLALGGLIGILLTLR